MRTIKNASAAVHNNITSNITVVRTQETFYFTVYSKGVLNYPPPPPP
jgi:hypothetical protein